jgi:hypothetical protein
LLGHSLLEKCQVLLAIGETAYARQVLEEGRDIALALGNSDLTFEANILRAKVNYQEGSKSEANRQLLQLLNLSRKEREEAAVHFELRLVVENASLHTQKALELYRLLYQKTPQYTYRYRVELLEKELN